MYFAGRGINADLIDFNHGFYALSDHKLQKQCFEKAQRIEFEYLNFNLKNIHEILENIFKVKPSL